MSHRFLRCIALASLFRAAAELNEHENLVGVYALDSGLWIAFLL